MLATEDEGFHRFQGGFAAVRSLYVVDLIQLFMTQVLTPDVAVPAAFAQDSFTHAGTGITFFRQTISDAETTGGLEWGYALPATGSGNAEYIGYIVSRSSVWIDCTPSNFQ